MILSLQYCKLQRKENESTKELMGWLLIKAAECNYTDHDRWLKEFINEINYERNYARNLKELTT